MKIPLKIITCSVIMLLCLSVIAVNTGCYLDNPTNNAEEKMLLLLLVRTQTRPSGCSSVESAIRFKNNSSLTYEFMAYSQANCGGSELLSGVFVIPGETSSYQCRAANETLSPVAYQNSHFICANATSTQVKLHDYTIILNSDNSWKRVIDY
jgi:hypothetical protein